MLTNMVRHSYESDSKREKGVVLTSDRETIAVGRVILGICAGLNRDDSLSLTKWTPGASLRVDNLFSATIAYNLGLSALHKENGDTSTLFGPSGVWSPDTECPAQYRLAGTVSKATTADILGDIDGFLLGHGIPKWKKKGVRLGQLLRMYYGSGISEVKILDPRKRRLVAGMVFQNKARCLMTLRQWFNFNQFRCRTFRLGREQLFWR